MGFLNFPVWKNKKGTSGRSCCCGSWKQHWINISALPWPSKCSVVGCHNPAEVGAHIYNSLGSRNEYIVPMCKPCNGKNEAFAIDDDVVKVSANVSETCKKSIPKLLPLLNPNYSSM